MKIQKFDVPFAQIPNPLLCDPAVSLGAKGLWAYIQSKPESYDFSAERIADETKDGVDSVKSKLSELEETGYLVRTRKQSGRVDYQLQFPKGENPTGGKSLRGKKPRISKKDITTTDSNINNKDITYAEEKALVDSKPQEVSVSQETPKATTQDFFDKMNARGQDYGNLVSLLAEKFKVAPAFVATELNAFVTYWSEKNHSGTKHRWQLEKTFEIKGRLGTWFRNKEKWGRTSQNKYKVENV